MFKNHLLTLIICSFFTFLAFGSDDEKKDVSKMNSEAFTISKNFVRETLKAPGSADFPTLDFTSDYMGENTYMVKSYVDAQNSFGAKLRTHYVATLKFNGGDWADKSNWTLVDLKTSEQ
ncbi:MULTISPECIES: hypothetical protein [unclassified Chitinophaga]|uniref:hypothetical protein n=1 Tax=unclassified Chitinophaga TaxID=2619133 RepID=UPI0009C6DE26|nr:MULTISPECIES: hypothetical protein [unclassified Chitinophaga]OMP76145.1 hypothetical protein BW716_26505 [[Flexibacter] sp. ATCC 35208]WPV65357.1 hypothetical protein QQL36_26505 [Chitinophaga sp. LS1]